MQYKGGLHVWNINLIFCATSRFITVHVNYNNEKIGWTLFQPPVKEDWYLCRLFCAVDTPKEDFFSTSESRLCFLFEKDTFFLKRKEKNISLFNYPQLLHLSHPPQVSFPRRREKEKGCFSLAWQHASLSFFSYHSADHFYAWNREVDWKHSLAIQTMKKGDPQSFIRYEDLQ